MASITTTKDRRRIVQFKGNDGKRRSIRLGKRQAEWVLLKVEDLAAANVTGAAPRRSTSAWLAGIGDELHDKLARASLVQPRADRSSVQLGFFTSEYIESRTDVKPRTVTNLKRAAKALIDYFGEDRPITSITAGDAEDYRLHLLGKGLSENTVRRMCGRARQFFRVAVKRKLIDQEPFADIPCNVGANESRRRYITRDEIEHVLHACPDAEWRMIFALSRYGGLRCTSEHLELKWGDIDWDQERITVRSPKTEHHEGKDLRVIPLFPELKSYLLELFGECEPGTEYVINRYRHRESNLRTQACRIIRRAGIEPWPKTFHNLRASRQTELCETFPLHVVCAWIGNSQAIAAKHYLQVTDEHWSRATAGQALQNPVQHAAAESCNESQGETEVESEVQSVQSFADECSSMHAQPIPPAGLEPATR